MLGAGAAIAGLAIVSVKAASDLGESLNKARVIFGDSSSEVIKFSETTAKSMGIAQSSALDAAGGFGAMFDSAGLAEKAAADMSIEMVTLAADMASFNNQDPSEMLERLRSGLAGEAEPLRRFGVFISEARVQTEAYASGIARAGEELTDAQKIQARFNIVMQDTAKQQGDFARTVGESLPNQLRVLKATLIDVAASLGKELLPAVISLAETLVDLVPIAKAVLVPLAEIIRLGADALSVLAKVATLRFDELDIGFTETANQFRTLIDQFHSGKLSADEFVSSVRSLENETGIYLDVSEKLQLQLDASRDAQNRATQAAMEWNGVLAAQQDATKDTARATDELSDAQRDLRLATLAATNAFLGIIDSATQLEEAQRTVNRLQREGKTDTKAYEQAVLDALTAQIGLEEAVFGYGKELADSGKTQKDVNAAIRDMARDLNINKGAVDDIIARIRAYINELNRIPDTVNTQITLGVNTPSEVRVPINFPRAQAGGFVERTGLAVIHKGEHVVPAGGGGVTINVQGWVGDEAALVKKLREALNRDGRRNGGGTLAGAA